MFLATPSNGKNGMVFTINGFRPSVEAYHMVRKLLGQTHRGVVEDVPETSPFAANNLIYRLVKEFRKYAKNHYVDAEYHVDNFPFYLLQKTCRFAYFPKFRTHEDRKRAWNTTFEYVFDWWNSRNPVEEIYFDEKRVIFLNFQSALLRFPVTVYILPHHKTGFVYSCKLLSSPWFFYINEPELTDLARIERHIFRDLVRKNKDSNIGILASDRQSVDELLKELKTFFKKQIAR